MAPSAFQPLVRKALSSDIRCRLPGRKSFQLTFEVISGHFKNQSKQLFIYCWSGIFTFSNRKMHTFELLIVKGDTLLFTLRFVSYDTCR